MSISNWELLLRLAVAASLCAAIGLERESRDQPAGLRTHILVGVGAALFTLVSAYAFSDFGNGELRSDPTRIAAQIVSGIGFLGAGAIMRQGMNIRGLTTAATLWIVAAVGMAAGAGFYFGAIATTAITIPALVIFRRLRGPLLSRLRQDFVVMGLEVEAGQSLAPVFAVLGQHQIRVHGMGSEIDTNGIDKAQLELRLPPELELEPILREISALEGVERLHVTGRTWTARMAKD